VCEAVVPSLPTTNSMTIDARSTFASDVRFVDVARVTSNYVADAWPCTTCRCAFHFSELVGGAFPSQDSSIDICDLRSYANIATSDLLATSG